MNNLMLPQPSLEQQAIVDASPHYNIIVDAVAGSGKTTTIALTAAALPRRHFLIITYNRRLRLETRTRFEQLQLTNAEIHTYHSFCHKYYTSSETDKGIRLALRNQIPPKFRYQFDTIIIDEVQDMTPTFYEFVHKIIRDQGDGTIDQLIILGDYYQSINSYNLADPRFITMADQLYLQAKPWRRFQLSTSYRLTDNMSQFLNHWILHDNRIQTIKPNDQVVEYYNINAYNATLYNILRQCIAKHGIENIFVLAYSTRSHMSPIRKLANKCSQNRIPIYVPNSDEEQIDERVTMGKLVFSTFHQTKGLERDCCIVMGFDKSFYEFYAKTEMQHRCPNVLYVALTRAKSHLIVIQDTRFDPMPFMRPIVGQYVRCNNNAIFTIDRPRRPTAPTQQVRQFAVTDLIRHLPYKIIEECMYVLRTTTIQPKGRIIHIDAIAQQRDASYESVSTILGQAIPAYYEWTIKGHMQIAPLFREPILPVDQLLQLACQYESRRSGYIFKLLQITDWTFLSERQLQQAVDRLSQVISREALFEIELSQQKMSGFVDCIDGNIVWEFKCVSELQDEHIIQLACYAALMNIQYPHRQYTYRLLNILSGEIVELQTEQHILVDIVNMLIEYKMRAQYEISDAQFLANCRQIGPVDFLLT